MASDVLSHDPYYWYDRLQRHRPFRNRIAVVGCCVEWAGDVNSSGYGSFKWRDQWPLYAHRQSYQTFYGSVGRDVEIHHKYPTCRKRCVTPDHLEAVPRTAHRPRTPEGQENRTIT